MPPLFDILDSAYAQDADSFHDAGFDAYATGVTFLRVMSHVLYGDEGIYFTSHSNSTESENKRLDFNLSQVNEYMNKVFVMRSDIAFIHLNSEDGMSSTQFNYRNP
jgi:hypothetical protein